MRRYAGPLAGALVIAVALPLFALAGWDLKGWAIAAVLWLGVQAFGLLLGRVRPSSENLAASGAEQDITTLAGRDVRFGRKR